MNNTQTLERISEMQDRIIKLESERDELKAKLESYSDDCAMMDSLREELNKARAENLTVRAICGDRYPDMLLLSEVQQLRAEVERWKESVAHAQREEGKRYSELNAANVELAQLKADCVALRADCTKWVAELENANRDFCNKAGEVNQLKAEVEQLIRHLHLADKGHSATIDDRDNWRELARELTYEVKLWLKAFQQQDPKSTGHTLLARFAAMEKGAK